MSYCPRLQRSARGGGGRRGSGGITCLIALGYKDLRAGAEAGGVAGGGVACLIALGYKDLLRGRRQEG